MRKSRIAQAIVAVLACFALAACGDSTLEQKQRVIAFTPPPTPTPVPKLCGNGVVDDVVGEQCEADGDCPAGKACVCCLCLAEGETLGERVFSVARPGSQFLSTGLAGGDVSLNPWLAGPLRLVAGRPDPSLPGEEACSASLRLAEDAILGFSVLDGSTVCVKFFAEGSEGLIDCDGGTAHDVEFTQDSNGPDPEEPPVVTTGLGDPTLAGPGAATLRLARMVSINVPLAANPSRDPADVCFDLDYDDPLNPDQAARLGIDEGDVVETEIAFTTEEAVGIVTEALAGNAVKDEIRLSANGDNFLCGAWTQEDSAGLLVGGLSGLDTIVGDTVNLFVLADRAGG